MGLLSLDCVKADGSTSADSAADLDRQFWGIRFIGTLEGGAGGNHNQQSLSEDSSKLVLIGVLLTVLACAATALGEST